MVYYIEHSSLERIDPLHLTVSHSKSESIASFIFNVSYPIIVMSTFQPRETKNQEHVRLNIINFIHIHLKNRNKFNISSM